MRENSHDVSEQAAEVKQLSFRKARAKYGISYEVWRRVKDGNDDAWRPYRGGACSPADEQEILDSVKAEPHLATATRARKLGRRTEFVQGILVARGISKLTARLKFAGYTVESVSPLSRARQHRVLAAGPGVYTCVDFKRFGALRPVGTGKRTASARPLCGAVCVDHFSGFGWCTLCEKEDADAAVAGVREYIRRFPGKVRGLILSDNGLAFLSDPFIQLCSELGLQQRTTQFNHPWSNGKVEALNKTLKYQCFPLLAGAKPLHTGQAQEYLDRWLDHYNTKRSHAGWINRGLPPTAVIEQWNQTPGDVFTKLCALRLIKPDEVNRTRLMGSGRHAKDWKLHIAHGDKTPYAFVIEAKPFEAPPQLDLPPGLTLQK